MTPEQLLNGRRWVVLEHDSRILYEALDDGSVDHVITDPPYEAEAHTKQRRIMLSKSQAKARGFKITSGDGRAAISGVAIDDFPPMTAEDRDLCGREWARITRRWILAFCQIEAVAAWRESFVKGGATWKRGAIWVKPDGQPQLTGDRPGMGFESIAIGHAKVKGRSRWHGGGKHGVFIHNTAREQIHPTTKPLSLMMELIGLFTDPDDVVFDPYCGSGTTGAACIRLGRRFIGIEGLPRFAALARERLDAEAQGSTIQDARRNQLALFGGAACG